MSKTSIGQSAEAVAQSYLQGQGLRPVARNWRCRFGEIDLIMQDGETLVFVEVRLRNRSDFGGALASVTPAKQHRLLAAARLYLGQMTTLPPCRFDVVAIDARQQPVWLRNAFDDMG
jgi:putative endonuclease